MFHIFVPMEEVTKFKSWLETLKRSMQSLTDKLESRTPMSAKDTAFMEELHKLYEDGHLDA